MSQWPQAAIEILKTMHAADFSAGRIVKTLEEAGYNLTRNAVVGMARRLKLKNNRRGGSGWKSSKSLVDKSSERYVVSSAGVSKQHQARRDARETRRLEPAPITNAARSGRLIDLDVNQCRFPLGRFADRPPYMFCTNDKAKLPGGRHSAYCTHHHSIAFVRTS